MNRTVAVAAAVVGLAVLPAIAVAHDLDHPAPSFVPPGQPLSSNFNAGGPGADWDLLSTLVTGNPHSDLDYFTRGGETYASVGLLGSSANGGGQSIVKLTDKGEIKPSVIAQHPSASCAGVAASATGLQHDVEATPKGNVIFNVDVLQANRQEAQLLIDASDAPGRCHDNGTLGSGAPRGGLEIIDVTDPTDPVEIGLTSHIGQSHTVNVDPRRPHIAYSVTSDGVGVDAQGKRQNEDNAGSPNNLDGFEVINLRSCLEAPLGTIPAGTSPQAKRDLCKPEVFRFRYPSTAIAKGHTNNVAGQGVYGCHELEVYPDDRLTCGSGNAAIVFDIKGLFDDRGTPMAFSDDNLRGTPLPCALRASTSVGVFGTGAKVTDCVAGQGGVDLRIPNWIAIGSPSAAGINHIGSAFHQGRASSEGAATAIPSTQDIDFDHELEFSNSGKFLFATDERGGGVTPPGATCSPGGDNTQGNGGVHAYAVDRLKKSTPTGANAANEAFQSYARTPKGEKAIFRAQIRTQPQGSFCTAHVFQQIPGQNRIFMGWYSQGTRVLDYTENADGTLEFKEAGYFIPENANEWVSQIFRVQNNQNGTFTYFGATGDGIIGAGAGRSAIDVYKVTLPAPPAPRGKLAGTGAGFAPPSCLARRVRVGNRNIGRLKLRQTRARTARRARPLGARITRKQRVLKYCVKGPNRRVRGAAVFDGKRKTRVVLSNATGHKRKKIGAGSSRKALQRKFGKRLRKIGPGLRIVRGSRAARNRVVFKITKTRVRYVALTDRKLASKPKTLRAYLRRAKLR